MSSRTAFGLSARQCEQNRRHSGVAFGYPPEPRPNLNRTALLCQDAGRRFRLGAGAASAAGSARPNPKTTVRHYKSCNVLPIPRLGPAGASAPQSKRGRTWPKNATCRGGRRRSWHYGIRPSKFAIWQATWSWAAAIAKSYWHVHWPLPSEIATQYLLLLLVEMKQSHMLRLPYRAGDHIPPEVARLLPAAQQPGILAIASEAATKRRSGRRQKQIAAEPDPT